MRPALAKALIRSNTAYRFGRSAFDIFIVLEFFFSVAIVIRLLFVEMKPTQEDQVWFMAGCAGAIALGLVIVISARELVHAVFDLADLALKNGNKMATEDED